MLASTTILNVSFLDAIYVTDNKGRKQKNVKGPGGGGLEAYDLQVQPKEDSYGNSQAADLDAERLVDEAEILDSGFKAISPPYFVSSARPYVQTQTCGGPN